MPRKLALKRLTASDLTLFSWHFRNRPAGNQKGFNLDARVLSGALYPGLGDSHEDPAPYLLDLRLSGPGLAPPHSLQRAIRKEHKNWRLNGKMIDNPLGSPGLYNVLEPGDFALFEFFGDTRPEAANVVVVAAACPEDAVVHAELVRWLPDGSMRVLPEEFIQDVLSTSFAPAGHPLLEWAGTSLQEDAALGGAVGTEAINASSGGRGISPEDFMRLRRNAEATGDAGEELLNAWLEGEQEAGRVRSFEWTARINAVAPYDFRIAEAAGGIRVMDAKSTVGGFRNPVHLSLAELTVAVQGHEPYDICRLYEVTEAGAKMRIARNIGPAVQDVLTTLNALPAGVKADSVSIDPGAIEFLPEVIVLGLQEL